MQKYMLLLITPLLSKLYLVSTRLRNIHQGKGETLSGTAFNRTL